MRLNTTTIDQTIRKTEQQFPNPKETNTEYVRG